MAGNRRRPLGLRSVGRGANLPGLGLGLAVWLALMAVDPAWVAAVRATEQPRDADPADAAAQSSPTTSQGAMSPAEFVHDVCRRIEMAARMWTLPPAFLARLIWQESRFDPNAISPVGAQGIAQFMPATARLRDLDDPFDPSHAIPASAHYLSDLRNRFGNLGLAAAAYNAGPGRVADWRAGASGLPAETWHFVTTITGFSPNEWKEGHGPPADYALDKQQAFLPACRQLPIRPFRPRPRMATAVWQPWGVHLTADWSSGKALWRYAELQRRHPKLLAGRAPMVVRVINYSMGSAPRFEVRIGQPDRARANRFCERLKRAGGICLVLRTERQ